MNKNITIFLLSSLLVIFFISNSMAIPFIPDLAASGNEGYAMKFVNLEQISATNSIKSLDSNGNEVTEGNWGIVSMTNIYSAVSGPTPDDFNPNLLPVWAFDGTAEITGIFYDIQVIQPGEVGYDPIKLNSTGGYLDLYYDDNSSTLASLNWTDLNPTDRTSQNQYNEITDGTFLGRFQFDLGAILQNVSISGTAQPTASGFDGNAFSYASVVDLDGNGVIDGNDGAWATYLDTNHFNSNGIVSDIYFSNHYVGVNEKWSGEDATDILGATSWDPALGIATTPEPTTMLLFGIGLLGLVGISRRKD